MGKSRYKILNQRKNTHTQDSLKLPLAVDGIQVQRSTAEQCAEN